MRATSRDAAPHGVPSPDQPWKIAGVNRDGIILDGFVRLVAGNLVLLRLVESGFGFPEPERIVPRYSIDPSIDGETGGF
jgi:hypothetical protein